MGVIRPSKGEAPNRLKDRAHERVFPARRARNRAAAPRRGGRACRSEAASHGWDDAAACGGGGAGGSVVAACADVADASRRRDQSSAAAPCCSAGQHRLRRRPRRRRYVLGRPSAGCAADLCRGADRRLGVAARKPGSWDFSRRRHQPAPRLSGSKFGTTAAGPPASSAPQTSTMVRRIAASIAPSIGLPSLCAACRTL